MADFDPDAYLADSSGPPAAPEPNSFDPDAYLANFNPDEYLKSDSQHQRPAPENSLVSGVREFAHAALPAAAGLLGLGAGGLAGTLTSPVTGPVGPFVGAVGGMVAGSMAADKVQHAALDAVGFNDDAQRQANANENPNSSFFGGLAPALLAMSPMGIGGKLGAQLIQRGTGAAVMGGFEAGQEYLNEGAVDPTKVAIASAAGAVLPAVNRVGAKIVGAGERLVPGRPGRTANPAADQAHSDVDDAQAETAVGDSALAQPPPGPDGVTTGNPQSAPQRSERVYAKDNAAQTPENDMLTQGDMDPATQAALGEANPAPPEAPQAGAPASPAPQLTGTAQQNPDGTISSGNGASSAVMPNANKPRLSLKRPQAPEPVVDTGIPQVGEPVAVGENEATAMPPERPMPELKGTTKPNDDVSDAQKAAGNYQKARTHDFGKPIKVETETGDTRRSPADHPTPWEVKVPADYGYFNKTKGADKDQIDFYRPKPDAPEAGDKHFIIDQRNAETGKFDEHKVMTYFKDLDAARETYLKGFSDDKALARLHDITEVDRPTLTKWLARSAARAPTKPYGEPMPKEKAVPKVVSKAVEMMREQGLPEDAISKFNALEAGPKAVAAAKFVNAKGSKTGVVKSAEVARIRPAAPEVPGAPGITAKSKADATRKGDALAQMRKAVADNAPTGGEMRPRLEKMVKDAGNSTDVYKPNVKPPEYLLIRKAKEMLARKNWKQEHVAEFTANEKLARSTNPEDHAILRQGNRIEADIGRSKRSGEAAITDAENKNARFDVPHEEAEEMVEPTPVKTKADLKELPKKTIDVSKSPLAIDTKAISKDAMARADARKAEAAALAGKKPASANVASEDRAGSERKKPTIDTSDPDVIKRLVEMSNKAAKKKSVSEDVLNRDDLTQQPSGRPAYNETARLFDRFINDEAGSVDLGKIKADLKKAMETTPVKSYISRPGNKKLEPDSDYTRGLSDELHKLDNANKMHKTNLLDDHLAKLPKEADKEMLARIYKAREADSAVVDLPGKQAGKTNIESLAPADKKVWDEHIEPLMIEGDEFHGLLKEIDPERAGPDVDHYIARLTKGNTSEYNILRANDDPTGPSYNGLSVNASMAKERPFVALENAATGQRHVIQKHDDGTFTLWANQKASKIKDPSFAFEPNQPYTVKNNKTGTKTDYIMRHAMTDEIEASGARLDLGNGKTQPVKYHKNAMLSAVMAHAKLGQMTRNLIELARLSSTPEFQKLSTRNPTDAQRDAGWKESKMPNFKGVAMDPQMREVFDDYARPGFEGSPQWLRNLNGAVTKLLFWMPTAHIMNVAAHAFVGRGFDNLNLSRGGRTAFKAMQSVIKQDPTQREMMENGAGLIYPSVRTRKFIEQVAKAVGEEMSRDQKKGWRDLADKAGVPFKALHNFVYDNSSKVMWAANDMFLTQRYLELKEKGLSPTEAIAKAERDIPNYRVPTRIGGAGAKGRSLSNFVQDPTIVAFGRYHAGMMNAYGDIARNAFGKDATVGDRVEALGKILSLGALAVAYSAADPIAKLLTGNEDASFNRRGPLAIPHHLKRAFEGKEDLMSGARSTLTLQPLVSTFLEVLSNKDFRGKNIFEPGDVAGAAHGSVKDAGAVALQGGEHLARGLLSPLSSLENAGKKGNNPAEAVRDQALDLRNPSAAARAWERKVEINNFRDRQNRIKHGGSGLGEGLYNKLTGR